MVQPTAPWVNSALTGPLMNNPPVSEKSSSFKIPTVALVEGEQFTNQGSTLPSS